MINETKLMLWRASATLLGVSLPAVLLGRGITFGLLIAGIICGLCATRGNSLRATVRIMLESWVVLLAVVLLLALLLCSALGIAPVESFSKWGDLLAVAVGTGLLFLVLREMPGAQLELLLKSLAIMTLAMAALGVLDAVLDQPRLSAALHGADKATTPYRLNFLSGALAVLLPYVWTRLLIKSREGEPFAQRVALPVCLFSVAAVLICGGRAGWVGLLAGVVAFLWLAGRWHGLVIHKKHWLLAALTVLGALTVYGLSNGMDFMLERVTMVHEGGRGMLSGRMEVWGAAVAHLLDNPLTGIGPQGFRHLPNPADPGNPVELHPHNWVLQMLLETGVLGTGIFVALLVLVARRFWQFAPANLYGVGALASLTAFLVTALANTSIFNVWWLTFLMFTMVLGWRAGWGGADLATRRRNRIVSRRDLVPYGQRKG